MPTIRRVLLAPVCAAAVLFSLPAFSAAGDSFSLSDDFSSHEAPWHLTLGAGWMIPLGKVTVPHSVEDYGFEQVIYPVMEQTPTQATSFEGKLTHTLFPSVELGMLGGSSTQQYMHFPQLPIQFVIPGFSLTIPLDTTITMTVSKAVPIFTVGPWLEMGGWNVRPFVTGGAGWYQVSQQLNSTFGPFYHQWRESRQYSGAVGSAGVTLGLSENGTVSFETRYEKVFAPMGGYSYFIPALHFGYMF